MSVMIIATRACTHAPNLARELESLGIAHRVAYVEDSPELAARYAIRHSPNLVVDDEVVFRSQPSEGELREFFARRARDR